MEKIKEIAVELSKGNVERAHDITFEVHMKDPDLEMEVIEIARQAIIRYVKEGDIDRALKAHKLFNIPNDSAKEALKQAVLSIYFDGNLQRLLEIKKKVPLSRSLREEIIRY